ncbi:Bro-N domain-containing protein [Oceanisphaera sp. KMM 10153]|uniref:BRO-N domain-containing protein n=1 Tax=Oceanisphaera submarina TaxID=3390193 RepID=UPI003976610C
MRRLNCKKDKAPTVAAVGAQVSNQTNKEGIDMTNIANTELAFHDTEFNVVNHNSSIWLTAVDLARALGYKKPNAVSQIYERNQDEFTHGMTQILNLRASGNLMKEVRVFSLRGAHLVAIFSKTRVAKAFRKWVLDVLDKEVASAPSYSTKDERTPLKDAVNMLIGKSTNLSYSDAWRMVHQRFAIDSVKELTAEQLPAAVEYVHKIILEGQLLPKETLPVAPVQIQLNYSMADWIKRCLHPSVTPVESSPGRFRILPAHIGSGDGWSPTSYLIAELTRHGYETAAIRLEHLAMRHYMEWMGTTLWQIRLLAQNCNDAETMRRSLTAIESRANTRNLPPLVLPA